MISTFDAVISIESLCISKLPVPLSNLINCDASPIANSCVVLLLAIQIPAVVELTLSLPLLIIPCVVLPVNCKFFVSVKPSLILPTFVVPPSNSITPCANDIDDCVEEICTSPSPASNSKLLAANDNALSSNFMKSVASPTANSISWLLFANQNPSVVDAADVLPLNISAVDEVPFIVICLFEVLPRVIVGDVVEPSITIDLSPYDADLCCDDICKSPSFTSSSNFEEVICTLLPSYFIPLVASPI